MSDQSGASRPAADTSGALDALIERTERRLAKVEESLNSGKLSSEEELKYTEAFTKLVATLRALYALKRGQFQPEEEVESLSTLLGKLSRQYDTGKEPHV